VVEDGDVEFGLGVVVCVCCVDDFGIYYYDFWYDVMLYSNEGGIGGFILVLFFERLISFVLRLAFDVLVCLIRVSE